ncbi:MAG: hypothetical protein US24_C0036G0001 [candidate division WS6 bacterium GW2011_GWC2_36_7]|uniref:Uncharacterized protein n=1 Tax=candidate division WS6 bacterium GW2011_GWC2_36_7 TaxID=1619091 RepID=A0A0G0HGK6_9BACT|nr:MAG: hypothetical protein US24_C0036G0001 [candidate division WS6 bacterium GW2011_GWC2_36_7]
MILDLFLELKLEAEKILNNLSYLLKCVIAGYTPILPISSAKAFQALEKREKLILFPKLEA